MLFHMCVNQIWSKKIAIFIIKYVINVEKYFLNKQKSQNNLIQIF